MATFTEEDLKLFNELEPQINQRRFIIKASEVVLEWARNPEGNLEKYNDAELIKKLEVLKIRHLFDD